MQSESLHEVRATPEVLFWKVSLLFLSNQPGCHLNGFWELVTLQLLLMYVLLFLAMKWV